MGDLKSDNNQKEFYSVDVDNPFCFTMTLALRWLKVGSKMFLQQKYIGSNGDVKWVDVPIIEEYAD